MHQLNLSLNTLAENLALDEALLDAAEAGESVDSALRLWESSQVGVVLGRSSTAGTEVHLAACREQQVPVLRRCSGGGTILTGPGCLMYALVLPLQTYPQIQAVDQCHEFVLRRMVEILAPLAPGIALAGTSDLVLPSPAAAQLLKVSGNAMRCKRRHVLYHGTLMYDFDLARVGYLLATPTREPAYRNGRSHSQFVANLPASRTALAESLVEGWQATSSLAVWPQSKTDEIVRSKYHASADWAIYLPDNAPRAD
ncbi:MAG: lipoate--protein ligase family protein [Pirellulales bacterium]|nr:lipoate--protein ligase family protein [Pirellulales bacterium]